MLKSRTGFNKNLNLDIPFKVFLYMAWEIVTVDEFDKDWASFPKEVQNKLLVKFTMLEKHGPSLGRPHVDTLNASKHANMKELRADIGGGKWRVAFVFDPERKGVLLVAGNKRGKN